MDIPKKFVISVTYPPITSYPQYAGPLSLIYTYDNAKKWFANSYIQLFIDNRKPVSGGIKFRQELFLRFCPFIRMEGIEDYRFFTNKDKLIDDIKIIISNNQAVAVNVDRYFIPLKKNNNHLIHSVYIYGYDDEKQEFYIADFVSESGKFTLTTIPYENMQESLNSMDDTDYTYKYSSKKFFIYTYDVFDYDYEFSIQELHQKLSDYYKCENTMDANCYEVFRMYKVNSDTKWGIGVYEWLIEYISDIKIKNNKYMDLRSIYVLLDHKNAMLERINYLESENILQNHDMLRIKYTALLNKINILLNLGIKYNLSNNEEIIIKMQSLINDIIEMEKDAAYTFLKIIELVL